MSDPFELDELWRKALEGLTGVCSGDAHVPDVQPLVDLLRSRDTPMPDSARGPLAELLSPGEPRLFNWKLVPERIKTRDPLTKQLAVLDKYDEARKNGMSQESAAVEAGAVGRQIVRYRKELKSLFKRARGVDEPAKPKPKPKSKGRQKKRR
jgi:hypothetical protein